MNSNTLLDEAKKRLKLESDNELAERLGYTRQWISDMRRKGLSAGAALQIATLIGLPEEEVLTAIEAEREKDPTVKAVRKKIAESMRRALGLAAFVAIAYLILGGDIDTTIPGFALLTTLPGYTLCAVLVLCGVWAFRRSWRLLGGLALLAFSLSTPAAADEFRIGAGINYGILQGDGVWQQHQPDANGDTLDNRIDNGAPVAVIQYVGTTRFRWLNYSVGIAHRDGPRASGEYVSDDCYYGTYGAVLFSGGPWSNSAGMPACDRRYFAKRVSTSTNAVTLTINPTWQVTQDFSLSGALGLSLFSTRLDMEWDRTRGVCQSESLCEDQTFRKRGATPYVELTARYSAVFVTGYYAHRENAPETMSDGNYGVVLGLAFDL